MENAPLKKEKVTQGTQVILPAYPILFLMVAGAFLFQSDSRTHNESFDIARMIMDIKWWGVVFLIVGAGEVFALMRYRRRMMMQLLVIGAGLSAFWAALIFAAAYNDMAVSWTSGMWVAFVPVAHIASVRSLARDAVFAPRPPDSGV